MNTSFYFDRTRNLALSSDAIHFYGESSHPNLGSVSVQLGIGLQVVNVKDTSSSLLMGPQAGNLTREVSYFGCGVYESSDQRFVWQSAELGWILVIIPVLMTN